MVWKRLVEAVQGLNEDDAPTGATVGDVFRTLAALSAEGVPVPTEVTPNWYAYTGRKMRRYGANIRESRSLRHSAMNLGWLWFAGTVERDGTETKYCLPAIFAPVAAVHDSSKYQFVGDAQISPIVTDTIARLDLLGRVHSDLGWDPRWADPSFSGSLSGPDEWAEMDKVLPFANDFAKAIGVEISSCRIDAPTGYVNYPDLQVHLGVALFESSTSTRRQRVFDLTSLDRMPSLLGTAFNALYGSEPSPAASDVPEMMSFRPLSQRQRTVARQLSTEPISVLSGAPGTGKTHLISVTAADAIARGESVLVLAGSAKAVDVLAEHFADTPGPPPVTFGGSRFGEKVSKELLALAELVDDSDNVDPALVDAAAAHDLRAHRVRTRFEMANEIRRMRSDPGLQSEREAELARVGDLDEVAELIEKLDAPGLWPVDGRLQKRLGTVDGAEEALARLRMFEAALQSGDHDQTFTVSNDLDDLAANEIGSAQVGGELLTAHWIKTLKRQEKALLREVASAVLVNRFERRRVLSELNPSTLTAAAPLWVGSLGDVDDVLPSIIGLFDLVIFDEASQIDQVEAANALVRAKRALICGDPQQIGFAPYLSVEEIEKAKESYGTAELPLNPQHQSLLEAGAAKFPVQVLDEHFRSAPHLIEFASRRFYQGGLYTATRHPVNEAADHIDLSVVDGMRNAEGVNDAEVSEGLRVLGDHMGRGWSSIGIITPFEAQADAFEEAVRGRYTIDEIVKSGIRVGTVTDFQGDECDLMIISFTVGRDEPASGWEPVNDPRFFNVMVTRAREHCHIVTSNPSPPGLAGEYVQWEEPLVDLLRDETVSDPWVVQVAEALGAEGIPTRTGYRVGRYVVDVVAGVGNRAVAVDCTLHPEGIDTHIDRALLLRRTGWRTADAFEEKWKYLLDEFPSHLLEAFPDLRA